MKIELVLLAILPVIVFMIWIYIKDKYEKEPVTALIKFFIVGIFVSILALIIESIIIKLNIFSDYSSSIYVSFIVAASIEEGLKASILIPLLNNEKNFNEKLDGIVYSVFLSLGFATIENIIYIFFEDYNIAFSVGIIRGLISIPAHIMYGITMGYYISKYKFTNKKIKKREYLIMSFLMPIILHGLFDFILTIEYRWVIGILIVYIIFLWKINMDKLDKYINISKRGFLNNKDRTK